MFTIFGDTRPNCDANEPQEDAQGTLDRFEEGDSKTKVSASSEEEGDIRKPQSKDKIKATSLQINCPSEP